MGKNFGCDWSILDREGPDWFEKELTNQSEIIYFT